MNETKSLKHKQMWKHLTEEVSIQKLTSHLYLKALGQTDPSAIAGRVILNIDLNVLLLRNCY